MLSIKENVNNTIIINKSKFITYLFRITSIKEVNDYIKDIKNKHKDATHHCYAYLLGNIKKFDDAKEPKYSAGRPILDVLTKNNLNYVLCIVSRYFGGIKLGIGGLKRAYTKSVGECLKKAKVLKLVKGKKIKLIFDYKMESQLKTIIKDDNILTKKYQDTITYLALVTNQTFERLKNLKTIIEIIEDLYVEVE